MSRMKSKTINIAVLLAALFSLVSCLDTNDGDYVYTDDSAVTAFSVTSAKKAVHVRASNGADSVYTTSVKLSASKFVIDQQRWTQPRFSYPQTASIPVRWYSRA